jgi:hypothetical protein
LRLRRGPWPPVTTGLGCPAAVVVLGALVEHAWALTIRRRLVTLVCWLVCWRYLSAYPDITSMPLEQGKPGDVHPHPVKQLDEPRRRLAVDCHLVVVGEFGE